MVFFEQSECPKSEMDARGSLAQGLAVKIHAPCHGCCVSKNKKLFAAAIYRRSSLYETHYIQRGPSKVNLLRSWTKISQVIMAKKLGRILFLPFKNQIYNCNSVLTLEVRCCLGACNCSAKLHDEGTDASYLPPPLLQRVISV